MRSVKFNVPFLTGNEKDYVNEVFDSQEFSGNGEFTKRVQNMLEEMNKGYDFNFDYILSSETNGYYKPHPSIYDLPKNILGFSKKETLHIAGSAVDVMGCVSSGLPCYWSNRKNDILIDTKFSPEYEFSDLTRLNNLLK